MQKLKNSKGITLIALIITIIVMIILVAVTVTVVLNGGLFSKAKQSASATQREADREELSSAVVASLDGDYKVDPIKLDSNLPDEWDVSGWMEEAKKEDKKTLATRKVTSRAEGERTETEKKMYLLCTSPNENQFKVYQRGQIEYIGNSNAKSDEDSLKSAVAGITGEITKESLEKSLPGWTITGEGPFICTSPNGNKFQVNTDGTITNIADKEENPEESFDAEEWDKTASAEDCFLWASDTPGTTGYGTVVGYTEKAQGNTKLRYPSRCTKIEVRTDLITSSSRAYVRGIEKVEIPGTVVSIGEYAFSEYSFSDIKEVYIEKGVKKIGRCAFQNRYNLETIIIPDSVTTIGESAFYYCTNLAEVTIPNSVTTIEGNAFYYCSALTEITIPDSVKTIGYYAFCDCTNLRTITISDSVTYIGECALENTAWYDNQPDGVIYIGKIAYKYKGEMPENTSIQIKEGTKLIANNAFGWQNNLTSITIPNSVINIGEYAVQGCSNLVEITISDSVEYIGREAFHYSHWYDNQPDGMIYIGNIAYEYKGEMPSDSTIEIREGTKLIADYALAWEHNLTSVKIPNTVNNIGVGAFSGCSNLKSITIPEGVTSINNYTLASCSSLTDIVIPDNVTSIGDSAFSNCSSLKTLSMPRSVKTIGDTAFAGCTALDNIVIWINVDTMGRRTFGDWRSNQIVNIEAQTIPSGWSENWNEGCNAEIEYGYTGQ